MKIGQYKLANEWMREESATPEEALNTWNEMEAEFKANRAMSQEPRSMDQAALSDDVVPGSLKDELEGKFNPDQETHEEYLQRINLERPFNMAEGGQLVAPSVDGSRPGYSGEFGPNIRKLTQSNSFEVQVVRGGTAGGKSGKKFYATFNFDKYGGEAQALKAAKEYRDSVKDIKKDTGKQSKGRPIGSKLTTGGQAEIRKALNDIIEVGGKSFSNEDIRKLIDMDLFPDDDQFRKAVDVVKKESKFKNLTFNKKPRPRLKDDPVSVLQAATQKRRKKKLDLLGSRKYEKELFNFKKDVQEGLGLKPAETTGAISGKKRKFLPIDMGHQSSIDQLKALKQKLRPEDLGPQFYRVNREGIRKFEGGVRTLEARLKKNFYPEQKKLYNQAKKFIDAGKEVPADLQNKIINSNERIQIFIDDTVKKYPLLKDRVNAITIDANDLTVKRGGNVLTELGMGLVDQDLGNIKLNSLDDLTIKANLAEQTLKEAVDAGLIDEKVGRQRLNTFFNVRNVRPGEAGFISRELLEAPARGAGRALNLGFGPMGAAGLTYGFRPEGGYDLRRPEDRITFEAEAALAPTLVKGAQSVTEKIKNPLLRKGLEYASGIRLPGINPANMLRAARVASPIGWVSLAGEGIYHAGKKEMAKRAQMSPEELDAYMLENQSRGWSRMAGGGIASIRRPNAIPPKSGPNPQGLPSMLNRVKRI